MKNLIEINISVKGEDTERVERIKTKLREFTTGLVMQEAAELLKEQSAEDREKNPPRPLHLIEKLLKTFAEHLISTDSALAQKAKERKIELR
jgi:hypothetical protein